MKLCSQDAAALLPAEDCRPRHCMQGLELRNTSLQSVQHVPTAVLSHARIRRHARHPQTLKFPCLCSPPPPLAPSAMPKKINCNSLPISHIFNELRMWLWRNISEQRGSQTGPLLRDLQRHLGVRFAISGDMCQYKHVCSNM